MSFGIVCVGGKGLIGGRSKRCLHRICSRIEGANSESVKRKVGRLFSQLEYCKVESVHLTRIPKSVEIALKLNVYVMKSKNDLQICLGTGGSQ